MPNLSKWNIRGIQYDVTDAQLRDAIAQPYSNTSTYAVGDYCLYNGTLYKCTTAISTAEEWTGAHWAETTLGQELTVNNADNINIIESLGPDESDLVADNTYAIGDLFTINGVLYKATAAIAKDGAIIVGTNCTTTDMASAMQENCVADVQLNGTSIINNNIANIPSASYESLGVVKVGADYGISSVSAASGRICIIKATDEQIKAGAQQYKPIVSSNQHAAAFYGLAKAAGDTTQANSDNAVGTYTDGAKSAIRTMIGAAAASDIPSVPVTAVQVNGTSIVSNGVANVPIATDSSLGVVSIMNGGGIYINPANGAITTSSASSTNIKQGTDIFRPISSSKQHEAVFYGLAKAAGDSTQAASDNAVGTYTDGAKTAIRTMFGAVGTADYASTSAAGIVKINEGRGIGVNSSHELQILSASGVMSKAGANWFMPIVPAIQDYAVFYGLAKAAGADLANQTVTFGTYPDTAKLAIQRMLGLDSASVAENFQLPYIEYLDDASGEYVINGEPNIRYVLGGDSDVAVEVTITAPSLGTIDVIFNSGTTPTVLTVPEGTSFPEWFDYTSLETNRKYEIIITDGSLGSVMSWPM